MKYCMYCGKQLDDGSSFCIYCGKKQEIHNAPAQQNTSAPQPIPLQQNTPSQQNMGGMQNIPVQQSIHAQQNTSAPQPIPLQQSTPSQQNMGGMQNIPVQQSIHAQQNTPVHQPIPLQQGTPVQQNMSGMQNIPVQQNIPAQQNMSVQQNMNGQQNRYVQQNAPVRSNIPQQAPADKEKKNSKGPIIAACSIVALLVAGILIGVYFLFLKDKDDKKGDKAESRTSVELGSGENHTEVITENPSTEGGSGTSTEKATAAPTEATTEVDKSDVSFAGISSRVAELTPAKVTLVNSDASSYPQMKLYFTVEDENGNSVMLKEPNIAIKEVIGNGQEKECEVKSFEPINGHEGVRFELVADKSSSMSSDLQNMQNVMKDFVSTLDYATGDRAEILAFDSYVMYMCTYTDDLNLLKNGIDNMTTYGETALYDALYEAVANAGTYNGARCVIAFTDGIDNQSRFKAEDVISLAINTKVPVFIIGTYSGDDSVYKKITSETGGKYWYIGNVSDMSSVLSEIYSEEKNMYCLSYMSDENADPYAKRNIAVAFEDETYGSLLNGSFEAVKVEEKAKHTVGYEVVAADISWAAANAEAIKKGGHLITITSEDEMKEAVKLAEEKGLQFVWMGGYTSVKDQKAYGHWITGENFDYQAWYPNEPSRTDNDGADEMYIMLWKIKDEWSWNDQRNDPIADTGLDYFKGKTGYIIEYEE